LNEKRIRIAVIGGGAAGFFAAIRCASLNPLCEVVILEKSTKLLAKVKVSGGGRCNVTHACFDVKHLVRYYPRGGKELYGLFARFSPESTVQWFESRGVKLKTEDDGRMFPVTDNSQTIIDCLLKEAEDLQVKIYSGCQVLQVIPMAASGYELLLGDSQKLFSTASWWLPAAARRQRDFHGCKNWVMPSCLRFLPCSVLISGKRSSHPLMGLSVQEATIKIKDQPLSSSGPLLITHWGLSGPAVLKLSSVAARLLATLNYRFYIAVNWTGDKNEEEVRRDLGEARKQFATRQVFNPVYTHMPKRLWQFLAARSGISETLQWANLSKELLNNLVNSLVRDEYEVEGKTTFKEEFVTCGGSHFPVSN
jgi:predicted Rossmann fold flavoprotein